MPLKIETFSNKSGGNSFYKAVTHPLAARALPALFTKLRQGPVAVYDPLGFADGFSEFHDLKELMLAGTYVQDVTEIGKPVLGRPAQPVTDLKFSKAKIVFIAAFDAGKLTAHIRHLLPEGAEVVSLDAIRLPERYVTDSRTYLSPLNFATNFAFFRDGDGQHTRLVTANYWSGYGAKEVKLWCLLVDGAGQSLAEWEEPVAQGIAAITLDSRKLRQRFNQPNFTGQLFIHAVGATGHDVVKYALDTFGDEGNPSLSCTHDANSWPADFYGGLPAPDKGEKVVLWVQNSHPLPISAGEVGMNRMGSSEVHYLDEPIGPFATRKIDVTELLPDLQWPDQIEIVAGKHFVRPRYEITQAGRTRIAHANVERTDLKPDPRIGELGNLLGKGYLLPAPILPRDTWRSIALPTPMATGQQNLPIGAILYDSSGREVATHRFGKLPRDHATKLELDQLIEDHALPSGFGHLELVYDHSAGTDADGWLHGLFRYEHRASGHAAETSFGAHVFNTVMTYRGEPQSYAGRAPGLSTRLFLRLGSQPLDTLCHLIYPASLPWHGTSATDLKLHDGAGRIVAQRRIAIPCSGSHFWRYAETFDQAERKEAGEGAYIVVDDRTCRLFGYHGLIGRDGAFSLDHMFGF